MIEIPLSELGLLSIADAAAERGVDERTIRRWIANDLIPVAVVAASGPHPQVYLIRARDLARFVPPKRGRPVESTRRQPRARK